MSSVTARDKLVERIRRRPPEASFTDVRRLLEGHGWRLDRQTGSHAIFVSADGRSQTVPIKGGQKVKRVYLDQICDLLGLDD